MQLVTREIPFTIEELKEKFDIPAEAEISNMVFWFDYIGAEDCKGGRFVYKELVKDGDGS